MPTACIQQEHCRIHLKSERLEVWGRNPPSGVEERLREIPIRELLEIINEDEDRLLAYRLDARCARETLTARIHPPASNLRAVFAPIQFASWRSLRLCVRNVRKSLI